MRKITERSRYKEVIDVQARQHARSIGLRAFIIAMASLLLMVVINFVGNYYTAPFQIPGMEFALAMTALIAMFAMLNICCT